MVTVMRTHVEGTADTIEAVDERQAARMVRAVDGAARRPRGWWPRRRVAWAAVPPPRSDWEDAEWHDLAVRAGVIT